MRDPQDEPGPLDRRPTSGELGDSSPEPRLRHLTNSPKVSDDQGLPVGRSVLADLEVRLPVGSLRQHHLAVGARADGRTGLNRAIIHYKLGRLASGEDQGGLIVVDSTGLLIPEIWEMVPPALAPRVIHLDFGDPDRPPLFNCLDPAQFPGRDRQVDTIVESTLTGQTGDGALSEMLLLSWCLRAIYEYNQQLANPRQEGLALLDVSRFVPCGGNAEGVDTFREKVLSRISDTEVSAYLRQIFQRQEPELCRVLNTFGALLREGDTGGLARQLFSQRPSGRPFPDFAAGRLVFLVSAPVDKLGFSGAALVGSVIVEQVSALLRSRGASFDREHAWYNLVCEECQVFTGVDWRRRLRESRAFGFSLLLSSPEIYGPNGMAGRLRLSVPGNVGCYASYRVSEVDARFMSEFLGRGLVPPGHLTGLHRYCCYLLCADDEAQYAPLQVRTQ